MARGSVFSWFCCILVRPWSLVVEKKALIWCMVVQRMQKKKIKSMQRDLSRYPFLFFGNVRTGFQTNLTLLETTFRVLYIYMMIDFSLYYTGMRQLWLSACWRLAQDPQVPLVRQRDHFAGSRVPRPEQHPRDPSQPRAPGAWPPQHTDRTTTDWLASGSCDLSQPLIGCHWFAGALHYTTLHNTQWIVRLQSHLLNIVKTY